MSDALNDLAKALSGSGATAAGTNSNGLAPAMGIVEAINADGTLGVIVNGLGSAVPAVCLASYLPNVGDTVAVLVVNNSVILVLGSLADAQSIGPSLPPGTIFLDIAGEPPVGCLACDGALISRTTYSRLNAIAAALGYPWGEGDGATTFNIPDIAGQFVMGAGGAYAVGDTGGAVEALLGQSDLPLHDHTLGAATWSGAVSDGEVAGLEFSDGAISGLELSGTGTTESGASTGAGTEHDHSPSFGSNFITDENSDFPSAASGSGATLPSEIYYGTTSTTSEEDEHTHSIPSGIEVSLSGVSVEYSEVTGSISGGTISDVTVTGTIDGETDPAGTAPMNQTPVPTLPPFTVLSYYIKT